VASKQAQSWEMHNKTLFKWGESLWVVGEKKLGGEQGKDTTIKKQFGLGCDWKKRNVGATLSIGGTRNENQPQPGGGRGGGGGKKKRFPRTCWGSRGGKGTPENG